MELTNLAGALSELDAGQTAEMVNQSLEAGMDPKEIILGGLCEGMKIVGQRYSAKEYFVPDMLKAAKIFDLALEKLRPLLAGSGNKPFAKGAVGLVKGNTQDNGKNIVRMILEANGVEVLDLGRSVPVDKFLGAIRGGVDFVGMSIMTCAGINQAKKVVAAIQDEGLRDKTKIIVGGAAIDEGKALEVVGADAYAPDAKEAVTIIKKWFLDQR